MIRNLASAVSFLAFLAAGSMAHAAPAARPAGANCTERATVTAEGNIAIHWVCVTPSKAAAK